MENIIDRIVSFNNDENLLKLREKYSEASFFEIIAKERSETTFSAFLKWFFQGDFIKSKHSSPVLLLLDILAQKSQGDDLKMVNSFRNDLVTRKIIIDNVLVESEKVVKELAGEIVDNAELCPEEMLQVATNCLDRIDLYIECLCHKDLKEQKIQIVIENKIDSMQGKGKNPKKPLPEEYKKASQTERYFKGTHIKSSDDSIQQIYVYLAPDRHVEEKGIDSHFIKITYQDILDKIIAPILSSTTLSARTRFFLEEFKNELTFPNSDGATIRPAIATDSNTKAWCGEIFKVYKDLIIKSVIASSSNTWYYIEKNGTYYNYKPLKELKSCYNIAQKQYKTIIQSVHDGYEVEIKEEDRNTLCSFWESNKKIISSILDNLLEEEYNKLIHIIETISKRDNIRLKYNIYVDKKKINEKPLNNSETAFTIIQKYIEYIDKKQGSTLEKMNKTFPTKEVNKYYFGENRPFNKLFFEYSKNGEYETLNEEIVKIKDDRWDFWNDEKHVLALSEEIKIIMLKMWRTGDLKSLIEKVGKLCPDIQVVVAGKDNMD
ncbi:MAG: PD-(D/E)XK nuclease family protein [Paludibacteraceae bacterium]|nr:PD-(D/E)XK nuclease family protein [Paludibacteraceae bacterium]